MGFKKILRKKYGIRMYGAPLPRNVLSIIVLYVCVSFLLYIIRLSTFQESFQSICPFYLYAIFYILTICPLLQMFTLYCFHLISFPRCLAYLSLVNSISTIKSLNSDQNLYLTPASRLSTDLQHTVEA